MKLKSFEAENVHGFLNFNVNFFDEVTFLIGINGSGKTTVLKLILGLTSPSYDYLSNINFKLCRVTFYNEITKKHIKIEAVQNLGELYLKYFSETEYFTSPGIQLKLQKDQSKNNIRHAREDFESLHVSKLIHALNTPKFLGLDRIVHEGRKIDSNNYKSFKEIAARHIEEIRYRESNSKRPFDEFSQLQTLDLSLSEAQNLIYTYVSRAASKRIRLGEEFRQKIFQAVFKFSDINAIDTLSIQPENLEEIKKRREVVNSAIQGLGLNYLDASVNAFFDRIENLTEEYTKLKEKEETSVNAKAETRDLNKKKLDVSFAWIYNSSKLNQINEIINFSQQYQREVAILLEPTKRLEVIASNFLQEGNKRLEIQEDGLLKVILKSNNKAEITELSSGEKQIIIMIAHLIFEEDQEPSGIFIIDEPELSLHIAWQEIFVKSIIEASPKTQFVLATHSPSIVAKSSMQKFCQDLSSSNSL